MSHRHSAIWLFGRSLLPSTASSVACLIAGLAVVATGTLLASLNYGTLLPNLFDGTMATFYTNEVVQPLETLFNSSSWSSAIIVVLWGLVGVVVYSLVEFAIHWFENLREARDDVQFEGERVVARHPLERSFFAHSLWRLGVSIVSFLFVVAIQPTVQHTFRIMREVVMGISPNATARELLYAVAAWMLIAHVAIVLLRLYTLRTRLFGDRNLYY